MRLLTLTLLLVALAGCTQLRPSKNSGFLTQRYYDELTRVQTPSDQVVFRFVSPDFDPADWHHVLVEPVVAYPKPEPTEQVSMETLMTLQANLTRLVEDALAQVLPLTRTGGEGVLRVEMAITGVDVSTRGLEFYEFIPIALVAAGVSTVTGIRDQEVKLFLESRVTDSASGDVMGVSIRELSGEDLAGIREKLELQQLNSGLEAASMDMVQALREIFGRE